MEGLGFELGVGGRRQGEFRRLGGGRDCAVGFGGSLRRVVGLGAGVGGGGSRGGGGQSGGRRRGGGRGAGVGGGGSRVGDGQSGGRRQDAETAGGRDGDGVLLRLSGGRGREFRGRGFRGIVCGVAR